MIISFFKFPNEHFAQCHRKKSLLNNDVLNGRVQWRYARMVIISFHDTSSTIIDIDVIARRTPNSE